jgi:hypothetical protein
VKRTPTIEVNEDFSYVCDVTKAWQTKDGTRMIRGVASGVAEDRDGERVSKRAIAKMSATPLAGGAVKLTSSHQQDWMTEIGDVTLLAHDAEHDELIYEAALPPEGTDPIADKAWRKLTVEGARLGTSIGGKLRKAYFELVDTAKGPKGAPARRRKVLDEIDLRHICLTATPSYRGTFAEAIAKTFTGDVDEASLFDADPADELADAEAIAKAAPPMQGDDDADDRADGDTKAAPDAPGDQPAAGTADTSEQAPGESTDAEDAQNLPMAKRHLACPNCGHEFAAELPSTDTATEPTTDTDQDQGDARKSQETTMDTIQKTLDAIRELAESGAEAVEKTETPEAPAADVEKTETETPAGVEKTETEGDDVLKMVAASHRHNVERIEAIEAGVKAGFETVAKAVQGLADQLAARPVGRKSVARVLPPAAEVEKTATETDDVAKQVEDAPDALSALKALNAARGIR